jgi:hypothetical protein
MAAGLVSRVGPRATTAYISVRGDFSPFDQQIKQEAGRSKARFAAIGKAAAAGIAVGVAVGGKAAVKAAVDLGEEINKSRVVFKKSSKEILAWSKTTATALGMSRRESLSAAGAFGNMLVPMGVARGRAADMSKRMVQLAADMASFNNEDPTDMLDRIRAGLSGESEPLKKFGTVLSETRVKQHAWKVGIAESGQELTEQQKIMARYSLLLKDTSDQHGDFARTSGSLANQQRILRGQVEDVGAAVGKELIPVLTKVAKHTSKFIRQMQNGKGPGGEFAAVMTDIADGAKSAGKTVGPVLGDIAHFAKEHPSLLKAAGAVTTIALGVKGIKGVGKITGITDLLGIGKGALGRGGGVAGAIGAKGATPANPVFVAVVNGGLPGKPGKPGKPGVPPIVTKPPGKPSFVLRAMKGLGWVAVPFAPAAITAELTERGVLRYNPLATRELGRASPLTRGQRDLATGVGGQTSDPGGQARTSGRRTNAIRQEIKALEDRVISGRRLVERLKQEGASTQEVSRAEKTARARTMELKQAQLALAEQTGASRQKIERLRGEIEKLRSKRISVAVDINIPSLNVRAKGNLGGGGGQGSGMRTGTPTIHPGGQPDGWGIEGGISRKVAARVRASAKRDPMAFLIAAGGGPVGSGPGAFHAFDPIAARFGLSLSSGYRPGSITDSGNLSYHAMNRAGDYADGAPAMLKFANFMAAAFGSKLKELIHTPLGFSIKNGQRVAPYSTAAHYDHVHLALKRGGLIPGSGDGDKVPVMAEPGEGFINKKAVRALGGPAAINAINRLIPRFQKGGTVPKEYARLIRMASKRYGIPANVLAGLIKVESSWNPNAVSPAGAFGLTQFMPGTATGYGVRRGSDHGAVASQILGAAHYLKDLGYAKNRSFALGAYNGGPGNPQYGYADDVMAAAAGYSGLADGAGGAPHQPLVWNGHSWVRRRQPVGVRFPRRGETRKEYRAFLHRTRQPDWWRRPGESRKHYRGRTTQKQRERNQRWLRRRGGVKAPPPRYFGLGKGGVLDAFINGMSEKLNMDAALAALTPELDDDIAAATNAIGVWESWLGVAQKNNDMAAITTTAQNLAAARETLKGLTDAGDAGSLQGSIDALTEELKSGRERTEALIHSQGPALIGALAAFTSNITGRSAGLGRSFPSYAGIGGLARS